jgi:hypothetical protein
MRVVERAFECLYSIMIDSGKIGNCPFCNSDCDNKTDEEQVSLLTSDR